MMNIQVRSMEVVVIGGMMFAIFAGQSAGIIPDWILPSIAAVVIGAGLKRVK